MPKKGVQKAPNVLIREHFIWQKIGGPILISDLTEKSLIKLVLLDPPGLTWPIGPGVTLESLGTIWIPMPIGFN